MPTLQCESGVDLSKRNGWNGNFVCITMTSLGNIPSEKANNLMELSIMEFSFKKISE